MKIGIVLGSIRDNRSGSAVADWVMENAAKRTDATFETIDVSEFNLPLLSDAVLPGMRGGNYPDPQVQAFADRLSAVDGYIFITAEYNHGIPGAFKNAVDQVGPEFNEKPVAFVSYGAENGNRAVEQWRQVVANFNMFDIRNQVTLNLFTDFGEAGFQPSERKFGELEAVFDSLVPLAAKLAA